MTNATSARRRSAGHPGYDLERNRVPQVAEEARALVQTALAAWDLQEHVDAGELIVSELVANAIRHASGPTIRIHVDLLTDDRLRFSVVDHAPARRPQLRTPTPDEDSGRGLLLLDVIADRWGYDLVGPAAQPRTKRVWAEVVVAPNVVAKT
ncbi:ATP-binding protein [Streptomyces acidiscabies]|uniref:ATP-binding protein n=1 Tax=Streptomyces acidiscabies TaxID=42234 RepID=A0ABU4MB74_9ACTN|nr:ATP-binding protein [Streptomyces acidiscabies]MDX3025370.1 ATP-binding protein [Streptomyces acidiscabies]